MRLVSIVSQVILCISARRPIQSNLVRVGSIVGVIYVSILICPYSVGGIIVIVSLVFLLLLVRLVGIVPLIVN